VNDAELRAKVREQYGDGTASPQALNQFHSGQSFQAELDTTHGTLLTRRQGAIYRHAKETVGVPGTKDKPGSLRFKAGGNPVDYTGHLNYRWDRSRWVLCTTSDPGCIRMPVAFDAKREGSRLVYNSREAEQKRQLLDLRDAAAAGAWAFLLVHVVAVRAAFIIHRPEYFQTLLSGHTVRLVESASRTHLLPSVPWANMDGWQYAQALPELFGLRAAGDLTGLGKSGNIPAHSNRTPPCLLQRTKTTA
jgi:hypothetical protein